MYYWHATTPPPRTRTAAAAPRVKEELGVPSPAGVYIAECVKEETEWVHEEAGVKSEPEWDASWGVSEAAARAGLYAGHEVKGELVVGPEGLQPPDVVFARRAAAACSGGARSPPPARVGQLLRHCTVRFERVDLGSLLNTNARTADASLTHVDIKESRSNSDIVIEDSHVCDICKKRFPLKTELVEHVVHVHTHTNMQEEGLAGNDKLTHLLLGLRKCSVRLQRCDDRRAGLRAPRGQRGDSLASHTRNHTGEETDSPQASTNSTKDVYACDTCGEIFVRKNDLIPHLKLHLRLTKQCPKKKRFHLHVYTRKKARDSDGDFASESGLSCEYCSKQFAYLSTLVAHRRMHTGEKPFKCEICKKGFSVAGGLKEHASVHTGEKPYSCRKCGKRFRVKSSLKTHEPVHSVQRPHSCETCGKGFANTTRLKVHYRIHTGEKPYSCKTCKKEFAQSSAVKTHERFHTGEKYFFCGTCKKGFTQLAHLKTHDRIHTQEKPYSCKTCKKCFTRSHHLKQHQRIHTGEKPYACGICAKKFADSRNFTKHKILHTGEKPHSCGVCKAKFAYKANLKKHARVHTGEKPYSCTVCKRDFALMDTLKKHLVTHSNEKPFSCGVCARAFARWSTLKAHSKTHAAPRTPARTLRSFTNTKTQTLM